MKLQQGTRISVVGVGMSLAFLLTSFTSAQVAVQSPPSAQQSPALDQIPDSPGAVQARLNRPQVLAPGSAIAKPSQSPDSASPPTRSGDVPQAKPASGDPQTDPTSEKQSSSSEGQEPTETPHQAVGTAVAQPIQTTGIAAARPVGAAVAPGKQRRTRSILIKVGALVGVGAAVGTTFALSQGSPSRPPGSH
jgi:hypothetical protein